MIFYSKQHKYYYEVDLHANKMYILYVSGKILLHRNLKPLVDGSIAFGFCDPVYSQVTLALNPPL